MDIRCRKTSCEHNDKYTCLAKEILIDEKMICKKYKDNGKKVEDYSKSIYEKTPEYAPHRESSTMKIFCHADCLLKNENNLCRANGITINDLGKCPFCISFIRK